MRAQLWYFLLRLVYGFGGSVLAFSADRMRQQLQSAGKALLCRVHGFPTRKPLHAANLYRRCGRQPHPPTHAGTARGGFRHP